MIRAIIHTTSGTTANLKATHLEVNEDFIEVYCGDKLHGMFDKGAVQFCYLSKSQNNREDSSNE